MSSTYCPPGDHPIFIDKPLVLEVNPTTVEVSWFNIVSKAECASRFFVKTENTNRQGAGRVSNLLPQTQRSLIVEYLEVDQVYTFQVRLIFFASIDFFSLSHCQVMAQQSEGNLEFDKSPKAYFKTSSISKEDSSDIVLRDSTTTCGIENPGFSGAPLVQQINSTAVEVNWENITTNRECANSFVVKKMDPKNTESHVMSASLPITQFSYTVNDLVPHQENIFQVINKEQANATYG